MTASRWSTPAAPCGRSRADHGRSRRPASGAPAGCRRRRSPRRCWSSARSRSPTSSTTAARVVNATETAAAQEKAQALQERFAEWCWEDPDRAGRLAGEYNRRFNSLVLRDYGRGRAALAARPGAHIHPPGAPARRGGADHRRARGRPLSPGRRRQDRRDGHRRHRAAAPRPGPQARRRGPEPHAGAVRTRVAAALPAGAGAGRLQRAISPASSAARSSPAPPANDWDAVILTRSAFERIPVTPDTEAGVHSARAADAARDARQRPRRERGLTVKRIEKLVLADRGTARSGSSTPRRTPGFPSRQTGIDYLASRRGARL